MSARRPPDDGATRQTELPDAPGDEVPTRMVEDSGAVGELRAALTNAAAGKTEKLALYALPDQIVVGRGSASDWQLDDDSLSRKHAQFRWNGKELQVEDCGSANGTKVNHRPVHKPTLVKPGDVVQLGTVVISFELHGATAAHAPIGTPDEKATRLVSQVELRPVDQGEPSDSGLTPAPLPPVATVLRPPPSASAPDQPDAPVFRPAQNLLGPDEQTRAWDPSAVLQKQKDPPLDWANLWRTQRRPIVLAGAAAWVAILLLVLSLVSKSAPEEDAFAPDSVGDKGGDKGSKTGVADKPEEPAPPPAPVDPGERSEVLNLAVTSFEQGRLAESLGHWRRLAASAAALGSTTDLPDSGARYMVQMIEGKLRAAAEAPR